jgi:UDP-N-acetylglucosamine 2-epimerase (non-hydrolysing)
MRVMTILGTRPEMIRLSRIIPLLDTYTEHCLVHTGQNYDPNLRDIFYESLKMRAPDVFSQRTNVPEILEFADDVMKDQSPDKVLILGDTNSGLSALMAKKRGIPVYHMEAGNRCFDDRVPEELNRRVIDHASDVLLPYTETGRQNLLREGIQPNRIYVTGNPIFEAMEWYAPAKMTPKIVESGSVKFKQYYLVTLHRSENLDDKNVLARILDSLHVLQKTTDCPVVLSVHPHLRDNVTKFNLSLKNFMTFDPFDFPEFIQLERAARCVLTDSGTVQEECCILNVPCVILRNVTERPETIEAGSGVVAGHDYNSIVQAMQICTDIPVSVIPSGYRRYDVGPTVVKILLGKVPV